MLALVILIVFSCIVAALSAYALVNIYRKVFAPDETDDMHKSLKLSQYIIQYLAILAFGAFIIYILVNEVQTVKVSDSLIFKDFCTTPAVNCSDGTTTITDIQTGRTFCGPKDSPGIINPIPIQHSQRGVIGCASSTGWVPPNCTECNKDFIYNATDGTCNQCKPNRWGTYCNNTCPGMTADNKPCHNNGVCLDGVHGVGKCVCDGFWASPKSHCDDVSSWLDFINNFGLFRVIFLIWAPRVLYLNCTPCGRRTLLEARQKQIITEQLESKNYNPHTSVLKCFNTLDTEILNWFVLLGASIAVLEYVIFELNTGTDLDSMYRQTDRKSEYTYFSVLIFAFVLAIILTGIATAVKSIQQVGLDLRQDRDETVEVFGNLHRNFEETKTEFQQETRKLQQGWVVGYKDIHLQKVIGKGAFGEVWKGRWRGLDVALKKMYPEPNYASNMMMSNEIDSTTTTSTTTITFGSNDSDKSMNEISQKMLDDLEVGVMMRLRHPRIVAFLGAGEIIDPPHEGETEPKVGIFVMLQYCAGGDLSHRLTRVVTGSVSKFPWKERIQCAMDIAEGMVFIHSKGIIHRDLKSLNILCDENGRCLIADLGLAKKMDAQDASHDLSSAIGNSKNDGSQPVASAWKGTVPWMAPEVIRSGYNKSVDVYSFGVIMWELITGRVPWFGTQYTFSHQIMMAVSQGKRPSVKKKELVDVPLGFAKLMKRCWDTKSNVRPKFADIVNELNTIMNNLCLPVPKKEPGEVKTSFELENPLNCVSPWSKDRSKNNELVATDGTVFTYKGHK